MFDHENLSGAKELLGDRDRAEGVEGVSTGVADDVSGAERDAEGRGGVQACVHACLMSVMMPEDGDSKEEEEEKGKEVRLRYAYKSERGNACMEEERDHHA